MRRGLFVSLSFLALAGCATGPSLRSRMAAYIGADMQTLVQQLGVPVIAVRFAVPMLVKDAPEPEKVVAVTVPLTCSAVLGLVVPMPTLPLFKMDIWRLPLV